MKSHSPPRTYRMKARAEASSRTAQRILAATIELWRERPMDEVTLQAIADRAAVSVQTVIRRFGSREGVVAACIDSDAAGVRTERDQAPVGDVDGAVEILIAHYERDGDAVLRTLALEERIAAAEAITEAGRAAHRAWCARVFAPYLPAPGADGHDTRLDAFVAATDVYLWKLLRRDLGRSAGETKLALRALLDGLAALPLPPTPDGR
jgi:AcrR family transcriptional regulator